MYQLYNTVDETVGEIFLSKNNHCLLLEGESDKLFWEHALRDNIKDYIYISLNDQQIKNNKKSVIEVIKKCKSFKHKTIGIVDLDYDLSLNLKENLDNLYYYNANSLETFLLLQKDCTLKIINLLQKKELTDKDIEDVLNITFEASLLLSKLRYINLTNKLNKQYSCNQIKIDKIFDKKKLKLYSIDRIIKYLSSLWHIDENEADIIKKEVKSLPNAFDPFFLHGHDSFSIFQEIIKKKYGIQADEEIILKFYCSYFDRYAAKLNIPIDLIGDIIIHS